MAEIHLAIQSGPGGFEKQVILKQVHAHMARDPQFVSMFMDEARLAARLSHPNIVHVTDFGNMDGAYFLCMEYLLGLDLSAIIQARKRRGQPFPFHVAAVIIASVCDALHYAHTLTDEKGQLLGVVHRDISPSNIFVTHQGVVKVLDFGIAKARDRLAATEPHAVKGKFMYMSPEQANGEPSLDGRSDVFSAGLVLYELLTGVQPFQRDDLAGTLRAAMDGRAEAPKRLRDDLPGELEEIVLRALAVGRAQRFQTADEMRQALERFLSTRLSMTPTTLLRSFMLELAETLEKPVHIPVPGVPTLDIAPVAPQTVSIRPAGQTPPSRREDVSPPGRRARWAGASLLLLLGLATGVVVQQVRMNKPVAPQPEPVPPQPPPAPKGDALDSSKPNPPPEPAKPKAPGFLSIGCAPEECHIYINGSFKRDSPAFNIALPPGRHRVKVVGTETGTERVRDVQIVEKESKKERFNLSN